MAAVGMGELMSLGKGRFLWRRQVGCLFLFHLSHQGASACDEQRLKPLGGRGQVGGEKEGGEAAKAFGVLSYRTQPSFPYFLAGRCYCPLREGFPAPKVPSLLAETLHPDLTWERQEGAIRTWGRETEKRWKCGRNVESEPTAVFAGSDGEGTREAVP